MAQPPESAPVKSNRRGSMQSLKSSSGHASSPRHKNRRMSTNSMDMNRAGVQKADLLKTVLSKDENRATSSPTKSRSGASVGAASKKSLDKSPRKGSSATRSRGGLENRDPLSPKRNGALSPKASKPKIKASSPMKQKRRLSSSSAATENTLHTTKTASPKKKGSKSPLSGSRHGIDMAGTIKSLPRDRAAEQRGFVEEDELNNSMPSRGSDTDLKDSDRAKMSKWPSSGDLGAMVQQQKDHDKGKHKNFSNSSKCKSPSSSKSKRRGSTTSTSSKSGDKLKKNGSSHSTKTSIPKKKKSEAPLFTVDELSPIKMESPKVAGSANDRFEASFGVALAFPTSFPPASPSKSPCKKKKKSSASSVASAPMEREKEDVEEVQFQDFFPKAASGGGSRSPILNDDDDLGKGKKNRNGKTRYKRGKVGPNPTIKLRNIFGKKKNKDSHFYPDDSENDEGHLLGGSHSWD